MRLNWGQSMREGSNLWGASAALLAVHNSYYGVPCPPLETDHGLFPVVLEMEHVGDVPQLRLWRLGSEAVVAVSGIFTPADAAACYLGWLSPGRSTGIGGHVNAMQAAWAEASVAGVMANLPEEVYHLRCLGHSFGGGVASEIAVAFMKRRKDNRATINTFGSPRVGDAAWYRVRAGLGPVDFTLAGDVVPLLPFSFTEAPALHAVHTSIGILNLSKFARPTPLVQVDLDQRLTTHDKPSGVQLPFSFRTLRSLVDFGLLGAPDHLIESYESRLSQFFIQRRDPPADAPIRIHGVVALEQEAVDAVERGIPRQFRWERARHQEEGLKTRQPVRVRVIRDNGTWCVTVEGEPVFYAHRRRSALKVARTIRRMDRAQGTLGAWVGEDIWPDSWRSPLVDPAFVL